MKKLIKINFTDFWDGFNKYNNFFINLLKDRYDFEISEDPEYLFYSCFGMDFLKYDCIRIFYTGEDLQPDFNLCDYAIGFSNIKFDDRYIRFPLYILYKNDFELAKMKHYFDKNDFIKKESFCNFIYSNYNAHPSREMFFNLLSQYKKVDSGGKFKNNIGYRVENKLEFQKQYKFSIAFENNSSNCYTTEKIIQAFAAKTIPIYWGNPKISQEFNSKSYINCHEYNSFEDVIERIKEIDNNYELYIGILKEPIFKLNTFLDRFSDDFIVKFICSIFESDYSDAYRRSRYFKGKEYENSMKKYGKISRNLIFKIINRI